MSTHKLAENKQATQSLDVQTLELPADLRLSAVQAPGTILLCRLEGGSLMQEYTEKVAEVAAACYNLTKKGKVTLTLDFIPSGARKMDIKATITSKVPQEERAPSTLFVTEDGQLPAHDPDQQRMDLRVVKTHPVEARIIDVPAEPAARDILAPKPTAAA